MSRPTGFTVSRTARDQLADEAVPPTERGHLTVLDRAGVRRLAARMNATREAGSAAAQPGAHRLGPFAVGAELRHQIGWHCGGPALEQRLHLDSPSPVGMSLGAEAVGG